jgi:IS30 family transposase
MKSYNHLNYENRVQIETLKLEGYSCRRIAKVISRHHTTVRPRRDCNKNDNV